MSNHTPPGVEVVYRDIDSLIPYAANARTHSEDQVAQIAASIREFGWTNPILLDGDRGVIAGHGRLLAARKLGLEQVPCIELSHLSDAQRRAYVLVDNKLSLNAGWDSELLRVELLGLQEQGFDLGLTGFSDEEAAAIINGWDTDFDPNAHRDGGEQPTSVIRVTCEAAMCPDVRQRIVEAVADMQGVQVE